MSVKRNIDEILSDTLPLKSKPRYLKAWSDFVEFADCENSKPSEEDYIQWFDHLKTVKNMQASSLWSEYSKLNWIHQRKFSEKLQIYPRLTQQLKSYNADYVRTVATQFTKSQLNEFLKDDTLCSPFWTVRKAIVVLMVSGGLRSMELKDLQVGDVVEKGDIYEVNFKRVKQRGEKTSAKFVVDSEGSRHVRKYLNDVRTQFGELDGQLIKGTPVTKGQSKYVNQNMGKNTIMEIGKDIARKLDLPNPDTYTSHTFRRSSATFAVESGATTAEMLPFYGWSSESTAQRYVETSAVLSDNMSTRLSVQNVQQTITTVQKSPSNVNKYYKITAEAGSTLQFN